MMQSPTSNQLNLFKLMVKKGFKLIRITSWKDQNLARLMGLEPMTIHLEGGCSIQLSYKRIKT